MPAKEEVNESRSNMEKLPDPIAAFLDQNRVATVCYTDEQKAPQCFTCFFAFSSDVPVMIFKSSYGTGHEGMSRLASEVAGSVLPEKLDLLKIKGIQFKGYTISESLIDPKLVNLYYDKYPFARVKSGYIWAISLESIKFTDNTLIFGRKTLWSA